MQSFLIFLFSFFFSFLQKKWLNKFLFFNTQVLTSLKQYKQINDETI